MSGLKLTVEVERRIILQVNERDKVLKKAVRSTLTLRLTDEEKTIDWTKTHTPFLNNAVVAIWKQNLMTTNVGKETVTTEILEFPEGLLVTRQTLKGQCYLENPLTDREGMKPKAVFMVTIENVREVHTRCNKY